jgi:AcrR family transcriptional regulator
MDEPSLGTAVYTVSVCVTATVTGGFDSVNALERAIGEATRAAGRQLYAQAFTAVQEDWLAQRQPRFTAQRWRTLQWLTPFGLLELPVRVVREKTSGRYFTLSRVLFRPKATRLLSPALEQEACAAATEQNYRPAARSLSRWVGARLGHWLVWACVQFHGARRLLELAKDPPPPAHPMHTPALISEVDSTWLKAQQRRRSGPVQHFPVHLGLHYTGRRRRYQARGSLSVRLQNKHLLVSAEPLAMFGRRFQLQAHQHFRPARHIVLSDGDEGLERLRENYFPHATWLLDRWHLIQAVRALTGQDQPEFGRLMAPIWRADSEAALEALRASPWRQRRPKEFQALFGYLLGNREGIDSWTQLPATLRRAAGRTPACVKAGSGAVEKNIEVHINRRFKRQGRSWHTIRAQRLLQLKCLYAQPLAWNNWWNAQPRFRLKPNPP